MSKTVDIIEIERCMRYFKAINNTPLEDIVWMRGSERLTPSQELLDEFAVIGLSNRQFPSIAGWLPDDIGIKVTTISMSRPSP